MNKSKKAHEGAYEIKGWKKLCESKNWHAAASVFPMMGEEDGELDGLKLSIEQQGLLNPVTMLNGKVLDGRNRLLACKLSGIKPQFVDWDGTGGSPEAWVVSQNVLRRSLSPSQKAYAALPIIKNYEPTEDEKKKFTLNGKKKWDRRIFICNMFGGLDRHFFSDIVAIEKWTKMEASDRWPTASPRPRPDLMELIKTGVHSISSMCRHIDFLIAQMSNPAITEEEVVKCPTGQLASEFVALIPKHIMEIAYKEALKWLKGEKLARLNRYWERMDKEYAWNEYAWNCDEQ